jgi:hypothetical protein
VCGGRTLVPFGRVRRLPGVRWEKPVGGVIASGDVAVAAALLVAV